jgi:hypothetical protein
LETFSIPLHKIVQLLKHSDSEGSSVEHTHITSTISGTSLSFPPLSLFLVTCNSPVHSHTHRWKPFDPARNWPDLGPLFKTGEDQAKAALVKEGKLTPAQAEADGRDISSDKRDMDWSAVLKRTFEAYVRGERPNMYGEWLQW